MTVTGEVATVPRLNLPEAILFDQDGTIVNSEPIWMKAEHELARSHDRTWTQEMAMKLVGLSLLENGQIIIDHLDLPLTPRQLIDELNVLVKTDLIELGPPWIDGVVDFFGWVNSKNIPTALVSASWRVVVEEVAKHKPHGGFDTVVCGDDVERAKPHPEGYLQAANNLGVDITRCLILEDSRPGVAAACASGARVVAIPSVVEVEAQFGLSRVRSVRELDDVTISRIMSGETVDTIA